MNDINTFKPGDIVKLKSGGPDMTVTEVDTTKDPDKPITYYVCEWFSGKKVESHSFEATSLDLVKKNDQQEG